MPLCYVTFQRGCENVLKKKWNVVFAHKNLKKPPQKVAYLWQLSSWEFFFSAAPTAQNSSELQPRTSFLFYKFFYTIVSAYSLSLPPHSQFEKPSCAENLTFIYLSWISSFQTFRKILCTFYNSHQSTWVPSTYLHVH